MTRKNKRDFFFFTQNESKLFLLALGGVWTKTKPRKHNQEFHTRKIYTPRPKVCAKIRQTDVLPINIRAFRVRTLHIYPLSVKWMFWQKLIGNQKLNFQEKKWILSGLTFFNDNNGTRFIPHVVFDIPVLSCILKKRLKLLVQLGEVELQGVISLVSSVSYILAHFYSFMLEISRPTPSGWFFDTSSWCAIIARLMYFKLELDPLTLCF